MVWYMVYIWYIYSVYANYTVTTFIKLYHLRRTRSHSKSTFIEGGARRSLKSEQKQTGGGGPSIFVHSLF